MGRRCQISGTKGQHGHRVSHAKNRRKHVFQPNLQVKKIFIPEENRYVKLNISTRLIRTIDKIGLNETLKKYNLTLKDITA